MSLIKVQQIGSGRIDVAGEFDLFVRKIAVVVSGELLAEDENRIKRRAQLVGHVGQELGFVFGCERQFGSLFFQRAASLFDLRVLPLHFGVLLGKQFGFCAQLLVGLLEFTLAGLKLNRELLRLRKQAFGTHRRFNGIENRADALSEQIQETPGARR